MLRFFMPLAKGILAKIETLKGQINQSNFPTMRSGTFKVEFKATNSNPLLSGVITFTHWMIYPMPKEFLNMRRSSTRGNAALFR